MDNQIGTAGPPHFSPISRPSSTPCQSASTVFPADAEITCFPAAEGTVGVRQGRMAGKSHPPKPVGGSSSSISPSDPPGHRQSAPNLHHQTITRHSSSSPHHHQRTKKGQDSSGTKNIIVVPPVGQRIGQSAEGEGQVERREAAGGGGGEKEGAKRLSAQSGKSPEEEGMMVQLQQTLFEHYHIVAYALVITSYFLAFCEYFYLRLISLLLFPETITYRRQCEKHYNEVVYRNELHFASGMAVFLVMSAYQLVCFFLLTVSSKYLEVKRTFSHVLSIEERLHHELVFAVKRTMFNTLFPTFAIYLLSSSVIFCSIFYMIGLRDAIVHVGSRVIVHLFDLFVLIYFLAFPILCVLFHPDINFRTKFGRVFCAKRARRRPSSERNGKNKSSQSFSQTSGATKSGRNGGDVVATTEIVQIGRAGTVQHICAIDPTRIGAANATTPNYGSLERHGPIIKMDAPNLEEVQRRKEEEGKEEEARKELSATIQTESIRRRMRQRRQSRYKRLRGSEESAEWQNGTRRRRESVEEKIRRNEEAREEEGEAGEEGGGEEEMGNEEDDGFGPVKC